MATRMLQRRGTAAEWAAQNPVLGVGEIGFETDTKVIKLGDGVTPWNSLTVPYLHRSGGEMTGPLTILEPTHPNHAARKADLDAEIVELDQNIRGYVDERSRPLIGRFTGAGNPTTIDVPLTGYQAYEIFARTRCVYASAWREFGCVGIRDGTEFGWDGLFNVVGIAVNAVTEAFDSHIRVGSSPADDALSTWYGYMQMTVDFRGNRPNMEAKGGGIWNTSSGSRSMVHTWAASRSSSLTGIRFNNGSGAPFHENTIIDVYGIPT